MARLPSNDDQPGDAARRMIAPYWDSVSIYDGPIEFLEGFERLPEAARHLFAVWWCDSEVCNGGFQQFFSNSTGVLAPEAVKGFHAMGLVECAKLLESAISRFDDPYPRDREARRAALAEIQLPGQKRRDCDPFKQLDDRYYVAKERESFDKKLDDFARRHSR